MHKLLPRSISGPATLALLNLALLVAVGALAAAPLGHDALTAGIAAALTSAVAAGVIVALITRAPAEVTAPASSTAVIYASLAAELVARGTSVEATLASLSLAVLLAGVLLLLAGHFRLGDAIRFLPVPVSAGFVTGLGLLVVWAQMGPLLGLVGRPHWLAWQDVLAQIRPGAVLVGLATAGTVVAWKRNELPGPAAVAAIGVGIALHHLLALLSPTLVGPTLESLAPAGEQLRSMQTAYGAVSGAWFIGSFGTVLPYAAFLAVQALMNLGVTSPAASAMTGTLVDTNRVLRAQGLANMICGLLAALPVSTNAPLSLTAARQRGGVREIVLASVLLFAVVLSVGRLLMFVPVAALAGTLIMSGFGLIDRWAGQLAGTAWRTRGAERHVVLNLVLVGAVAASFLLGSVPFTLLVGSVLAMALLALNLSASSRLSVHDASELASTRVWSREQNECLAPLRRLITIVRPRGGLFFGTADQLARAMAAVPAGQRHCIVDLTKASTLDATACQLIAASARRLARRDVSVRLAGLDPTAPESKALLSLGLDTPPLRTRWFVDLDHALESVEEELLLGAGLHRADRVTLEATPLARGLSQADVADLAQCLIRRTADPGALFSKGAPADSMFVVDSGRVEISMRHPELGKTMRLASFGPGGVFGEVSVLSTGIRSADAWCVEPSVLYEFTRDSLDELAWRAPRLHAQLLRNLGVHLANRLVIADSTMESQL